MQVCGSELLNIMWIIGLPLSFKFRNWYAGFDMVAYRGFVTAGSSIICNYIMLSSVRHFFLAWGNTGVGGWSGAVFLWSALDEQLFANEARGLQCAAAVDSTAQKAWQKKMAALTPGVSIACRYCFAMRRAGLGGGLVFFWLQPFRGSGNITGYLAAWRKNVFVLIYK